MTIAREMPRIGLRLGKVLAAAFVLFAGAGSAQAQTCNRACLIKLTDDYVAALVKHDPKAVPLASDVRFVENVKRTRIGDGLWSTASGGPTKFSVHVPDAANQTAGWIGMIENKGEPTMVAIRLKLAKGKIVEAEHLVTGIRKEQMDKVQTPRPRACSPMCRRPTASRTTA